jgi:hypothetical protein
MLDQLDAYAGAKKPLRIWLDAGSDEGSADDDVMEADDILLAKPSGQAYVRGADLACTLGQGQAHNEAAWRARSPWALEWLYPDEDRVQPAFTLPSELSSCP